MFKTKGTVAMKIIICCLLLFTTVNKAGALDASLWAENCKAGFRQDGHTIGRFAVIGEPWNYVSDNFSRHHNGSMIEATLEDGRTFIFSGEGIHWSDDLGGIESLAEPNFVVWVEERQVAEFYDTILPEWWINEYRLTEESPCYPSVVLRPYRPTS